MENQKFNSSFIPKRNIEVARRPVVSGGLNLLAIIGIVIFVLSIILAVSVFLYQKTLVKKIQLSNEKLLSVKGSLDPEFINELISLDKKLKSASALLSSHQTISPIFSLLESKTLEKIRFKSFKYSIDDNNQIDLSIIGEADSFNAIALQSDIFGASDKISDPVFRNFVINDDGNVNFDFSGTVDSKAYLYSNVLNNNDISTSTDEIIDATAPTGSDILIDQVGNSSQTEGNNGEFNNLPEF